MAASHLKDFCKCLSRQKILIIGGTKISKLSKCLKTFDLMAIGIGSTFGSGIYVLTGQVAKEMTGPAVVLSFFIAAIVSLMSGLCYTEFAIRVPVAGSAYVYTYVAIGELVAFSIGWNLILEYVIGGAVIARAFSVYVDTFTGGMIANATREAMGAFNIHGFASQLDFLSFGLVILLTLLLISGVKNSAMLNNVLTVFNLGVAACIVVIGLFYVDSANWSNFAPFGLNGVLAGASTCFYAFIGFDIIATTAEEARNPAKSIPWSILGTITICFVMYFAVSTVVTLMVPYQNLNPDSAVSDAFSQVGANWAKYFVSAGAGISMLCCTLVSLFPLPRILYSMSQDGLIPACFSKVNTRTESPIIATVVAGIFTAVSALLINLHELVEMLSIGTLLAYSMVNVCLLKLRYQVSIARPSSTVTTPVDPPHDNLEKTLQKQDQQSDNKANAHAAMEGSRKREMHITLILLLIVADFFSLSSLLVYGKHVDAKAYYFLLCLSIIIVILCGIFLWKQPQDQQELLFKVPCVPFLPMVALFANIYLMMELRRLTWIRVLVWTTIGMIIYFGYGIRHSVAAKGPLSDEYSPLVNVQHKTEDKSAKSE